MAMTTETHPVPSEHNPLASMPHDTHGGISNPVLGMLLFITSEVMFFGGLFAAYFSLRANAAQWPPINPESGEPFQLAILPFVGPATILLILSSVTCQMAVWGIRRDDRTAFIRAMAVTVVLGIVFLTMQLIDYSLLGSEGLTLSSGQYGTTYYTLTGFHGAHVTAGVLWLLTLLAIDYRRGLGPKDAVNVDIAALYWHFVDVVWIAIFTLIYLLQ